MARIRTIKPEFWTSEQVMQCSRDARLLFIGIWNFADDGGRIALSVIRLKAQVLPGDACTNEDIRRWLDELSSNNLVEEYSVENKAYLQVTGWHHQKIEKPNYLFPDKNGRIPDGWNAISRRTVAERTATESSRVESKGRESKGRESNRTNPHTRARARSENGSVESAPPDVWPNDYRQQFEEAYPHKVSMAAALAMLDKARGKVAWRVVMNGIANYCANKPDDRNWMNPKTWIEGERWNDKPASRNGKHEHRHLAHKLADEARRAADMGNGPAVSVGGSELGGDNAHVVSRNKPNG